MNIIPVQIGLILDHKTNKNTYNYKNMYKNIHSNFKSLCLFQGQEVKVLIICPNKH